MRGGTAAGISSAVSIAVMAVLAGCGALGGQVGPSGSTSHAVKTEALPVGNDKGTRVITNLTQVSSAPPAMSSLNSQNLVSGAVAMDGPASGRNQAQDLANRNLQRLYLSKQQDLVHGGETRAAGDRTLLNAKARKFPEFSYALLNQTLVVAQELATKNLQEHKLPEDIKPMILTAVMTPEGKLFDIAVEQHTGVGAVDRIIIDACKKGLWTMNPPRAALSDDGMFRMRFEGVIGNHSYDVQGNYTYITHVGLALL
jgi:hypothetical protein